MIDFEYAAAATLDEAVTLLAARGERAKILAGGTDILVQLREGQREADLVVDVKRIPELTEVRHSARDGLRLGGAAPCYKLYEDAEIATAYAALADAARIIGGWQIQTRASVGGNLCNSSPAADSIPPLIVYNATCHIVGPDGTRDVPAAEFCTAPGRNALKRGELLAWIDLPPQPAHSGAHYLRFIPRNEMDIAVVGCGAWLEFDPNSDKIRAARIALAAVAPTPVLAEEAATWLVGREASDATFAQAGELARKVATPISDMRGPAEYRTHLVGVLAKRALCKAAERAKQR